MSIRRITISVPAEVARRVKQAAARGSVSSWITGVIEQRFDDAESERLWEEFYRSVAPRPDEVRRAGAMFRSLTGRSRRKRAA